MRSPFSISSWAIGNPIPVILMMLGALLAGIAAYPRLAVAEYPNVDLPAAAVIVTENGAAPAQLELQVTRPVEDAVAAIPGVRNVESTISQGVSTTSVQFEFGRNLQKEVDEVRSAISRLKPSLPHDIDEPTIEQLEPQESTPILTFAVASTRLSPEDLSWFVDDTISQALRRARGVSRVARLGGQDREINVVIDPDRLEARGLTASEVSDTLHAVVTQAPGGRVRVGGREQALRILGDVTSIAALRDLEIPTREGRFVKLADVADIGDGAGETRSFAQLDGRRVIAFQVFKASGASDIAVEDGVAEQVAALQKAHPDLTISNVFSSVDETRASLSATQHVLVEGMLLATLVVFLFLRDWRATFITGAAMPMALVPTFAVMKFTGCSLNIVTLLALILVIGVLVDDVIVEVENIQKRLARGLSPYEAALKGADGIGLAVVATSLAIVAVFAPVSFMPGAPGQYFKEFGLTVSAAVIFSLIVARMVTPLMAAYLLTPPKATKPSEPRTGAYLRILDWALRHKGQALAAATLCFVATLAIVPSLPLGLQPAADPDFQYVDIQGPAGATLEDMEEIAIRLDGVFRPLPDVRGVFVQIGSKVATFGSGAAAPGGDLTSGSAIVMLDPHRRTTGPALRRGARTAMRAIPDAQLSFLNSGGEAGFQQVLSSDDLAALNGAANQLQQQMAGLTQVIDPHPAAPPTSPEIDFRPIPDAAARLGVSATAVANIARVATVGETDANVARFDDAGRRIPIRVRLPDAIRADPQRLRTLRVPAANGTMTTLESLATIDFSGGPGRIDRLNREREMAVRAERNGVETGDVQSAVGRLPIMRHLPKGVHRAIIGDQQDLDDLVTGFLLAMGEAIFLMFAVLALLFRSFFKPAVILIALPLAMIGAILALWVTRLAISVPSLIGLLMVLGVAAKNSILLVEYAIVRRAEGVSRRAAIREACQERARPIIMTTVAMLAGMAPTAIGIGKGVEFRQPMAVAVIGGLISSALLSLVIVPVIYEIVEAVEDRLRPRLARLVTNPSVGTS
jgi:HAE1 family hydrophobic/amphiphilic exporter-1